MYVLTVLRTYKKQQQKETDQFMKKMRKSIDHKVFELFCDPL